MSQECCICKQPIADERACFLKIDGVIGFYHHMACGHLDGGTGPITPAIQACISKLRAYIALVRVVEGD